jgi:diaminopimelate epimerase
MRFVKAHGAGNDFVLLPDSDDRISLDASFVRSLCDRHRGLGADGVIRLAPPRPGVDAHVFMDYRNADGSLAEMCGNGVRCVAKYVAERQDIGDLVRVDTPAGVKPVQVVGRDEAGRVTTARVDMGAPRPTGERQVDVSPLRQAPPAGGGYVTAEKVTATVTTLAMGNPHAVLVVDDISRAPVTTWGPVIEGDDQFPDGTNVEFIAVPARDRVLGRIWERGVGETMASGTGSAAMAAAAHLLGLAERAVVVEVPGGALEVEWAADTLYVTGPAVEVASGTLDESWLERLQDPL